MAYNVKNTSGQVIATVPDTKIDTTSTSLSLVGYKATKYGVATAENFVHLLEHFANSSPPENPVTGQLWFDTNANTLKVRRAGGWSSISSTPSTGGDPTQGGIAGVYHCPIGDSSALLMFAGGKIVAVVASKDMPQSSLPPGVTIEATEYPFQSLFPFGLQGGVNLADGNDENNPDDYVISGRVPLAEQAHFAGGGVSTAEVSGWGYMDLGPGKSVGLMISNGTVVAAVASAYVSINDMPNTVSFYVKKDRDTGTGTGNMTGEYKGLDANYNKVTITDLKAKFPGKTYKVMGLDNSGNLTVQSTVANVSLFPGMTFANLAGTDLAAQGSIGQLIYSVTAAAQTAYGTALASAIDGVKVWVDNNSATAQKVTQLEATFTSATGTTSLAEAVAALIAQATDTGAVAAAITQIKSEFQTALGTTSFAEALNKLNTSANQAGAASSAVTEITSAFTNQFGGVSIAQAVSNLYTRTDSSGNTVAGWGLSLNSNGYVTGVEALNGGASNNYFKITASNFIIGDNNIDFIPFAVRDGVVYMKDVVAENITYGSLTPKFGGNYNRLDPWSGYQVFPGGFIIQWGRVRRLIRDEQSFGISFPTPFPNGVMAVTAMPFISYFNDRRDLWMQNTGEATQYGCVFSTQSSTSNSQQIDGFDWMAYGY